MSRATTLLVCGPTPIPGSAVPCLSCGAVFPTVACVVMLLAHGERIGCVCRQCLSDEDRETFDSMTRRQETHS